MNKLLLLTAVSLFSGLAVAQKGNAQHLDLPKCSQHHKMLEMQASDPLRFSTVVNAPAGALKAKYTPAANEKDNVVYTIPVVFHVLHTNGAENISAAQIQDQLNILNRDYRRLNADANQVQPAFQGMPADIEIEFKLATVAPNGACFDGITRTVTTMTNNGDDGEAQIQAVVDGNDIYHGIWPHNKYLNIYVAADIGGAAGYTFLPNGNSTPNVTNMYYNGIFLLHDYCGSVGTGSVGTSRALTHEVGHWLNLKHTWGDGNTPGNSSNCGQDDGVQDTPNCAGVSSCNLTSNSCNSDDAYWGTAMVDNVENYMDYSYCSKMFTAGQATRMRTAIVSSTGGRSNIWTTANLQAVGAIPGTSLCALDFDASQTGVCAGTSVTFTPNTASGIATYSWNFPGGTPSSSTAASPVVTYNTAGSYNATLSVTSTANGATYTESKTSYIFVGNASAPVTLPFSEGFTSATFPPAGWTSINGSGQAWKRSSTVGLAPTAGNSMQFDNYNYDESDNDEVRLTPLDLSAMQSATLTFDVAYRPYSSAYSDGLEVLVSTNCGGTFTSVYSKAGTTLSTVSGYTTSSFTPSGSAQWRTETIDLTPYTGQSGVIVAYRNIPGNGNNLYIDNINISGVEAVPVPSATFTASQPAVCEGGSITFTSTSDNNPTSYNWTFPGGSPASSTEANPTVTYASAGNYTATLSASNADGTGTTGQSVTINPNPSVSFSSVPTLCVYSNPVTLTQGSPSGGSYSGNGVSGGLFDPEVSGAGTQTLTYNYTTPQGCPGSATATVNVDECLGLGENDKPVVSIYPNPSSGMIHIAVAGEMIRTVKVYDFAGRLVLSTEVNAAEFEADLSKQAAGVYRVTLETAGSSIVTPVFIQK